MTKEGQTTAVQVALRIRPLTDRDRAQPRFANLANDDVLKPQDKTVQVVSQNKYFSFDHVFGTTSTQEDVFKEVGDNLIRKFIDGYNITILAYGQTSSGKTHTMGTASVQNSIDEGIVPRSMSLLFDLLQDNRPASPALSVSSSSSTSRLKSSRSSVTPSFLSQPYNSRPTHRYTVTVSFIEIYNEDLHDLLNSAPPEESPPITIREDTKGNIYWTGVKEVQVSSAEDVLFFLEQGTQNRATGATDMNEKSSRSHAIFSVTLRQEKLMSNEPKKSTSTSRPGSRPASSLSNRTRSSHTPKVPEDGEWMITVSKFHFVDLAGSERLKRTAAKGDRRKEGININAGLLALGNVISALASDNKKKMHIPYRDSKLTRLLQDSLGGNATTVMIACVSPAEYNLAETLNTLQYANRARSIKNRSEKNEIEEWMTTDNIELLRSLIGKLKHELRYLKSPGKSKEDDSDEENLDQRLLIADLQRQVEELDVEATVTRERNRMVEKELHHLRILEPTKKQQDFQHLVEPVIEEYEKSISNLESQLALTKAALNYSDTGFEEQLAKIQSLENAVKTHELTTADLHSRLSKVMEREQSNESYILELETKLITSAKESTRDQTMLNDLKGRIMKLKETDEKTEQYIHDLEQRLALADAENKTLQNHIEDLEAKLEAKERTNVELLKRLSVQKASDVNEKLMLKELDQVNDKLSIVQKERDLLKQEINQLQAPATVETKDQADPNPPERPSSRSSTFSANRHSIAEESQSYSLMQAQNKLAQESERNSRLQQTLDRLQIDHQETLKELDETVQRYHEAVEQLDFMDHSRSSSTTQEEGSLDLNKEISIAKEVEEKQEYLGQISQLQKQLGLQEREQEQAMINLRQELESSRKQLEVQAEQRAAAQNQTQQTIEQLEHQIERLSVDLASHQENDQEDYKRQLEELTVQFESSQRAHDALLAMAPEVEDKMRLLEQVTQEKEVLVKKSEEQLESHLLLQAEFEQKARAAQEKMIALQTEHKALLETHESREKEWLSKESEWIAKEEERSQQIQTEQDQLISQYKELKQKWISVQEESRSLQALLDASKQELETLRANNDVLETKKTADLEEKLKELSLQLERQQTEDEEIQTAMDEECQKLKAELRKAQEELAVELLKIQESSADKEKMIQLEATLVEHKHALNEAQSLHKEIEEKYAQLESHLAQIEQDYQLAQETNNQKQKHIEQQRLQMDKEAKGKEQAEKQLEKVRFELSKSKSNSSINFVYEDRIQQLEKQLTRMSDENAEYTSLSEELEKEMNRITQEQEELVQEYAQAEEDRTRYQRLIKDIKQSLKLTSQDDDLIEDIQKLLIHADSDRSQDKTDDLAAKHNDNLALKKLQEENKKLNEQQREDEQLIEELEELKQSNDKRISGLEAIAQEHQDQLKKARDEFLRKLEETENEHNQRLETERTRAEKAERLNLKLEKQLEEFLKAKKSFMCF
ncbi:unnamed protein product [Rhizopus stolonifer]